MAKLLISSFTRYELTSQELLQGTVLNEHQKLVIQNRLCTFAEEKISFKFDPTNPTQFAQREAELQGQILLLKQLLDESDSAQIELTQIAVSQPKEE